MPPPAHLVYHVLNIKICSAIIFIATEKVATHSQSCFFNTNFSDREVHYEKKRTEDRPFVFVFHLSLRKCCLFLTLSLYPPKLALLRQSLYVLPDEKWKLARTFCEVLLANKWFICLFLKHFFTRTHLAGCSILRISYQQVGVLYKIKQIFWKAVFVKLGLIDWEHRRGEIEETPFLEISLYIFSIVNNFGQFFWGQ